MPRTGGRRQPRQFFNSYQRDMLLGETENRDLARIHILSRPHQYRRQVEALIEQRQDERAKKMYNLWLHTERIKAAVEETELIEGMTYFDNNGLKTKLDDITRSIQHI